MAKQEGNLSDEQYQNRMRQAQKQRERQSDDDYKQLMATPWGRRIAYRQIFGDPSNEKPSEFMGRLTASVFDSHIKDGMSCALLAARIDGARMFSIELHKTLERVAPSALVTMLEEQLRDRVVALSIKRTGE